jgi:hypothetical protein
MYQATKILDKDGMETQIMNKMLKYTQKRVLLEVKLIGS